MADPHKCPPLVPESIRQAHELIKKHVHYTPLLTSKTLNQIASSPTHPGVPAPKFNLFFKCENYQKIGAFKARGAFHAVKRLINELGLVEVQRRGVVTHSSGNHAQALALAAHTFSIPAYIVMPSISTPSKIAATRIYTDKVTFSGSTSEEREAKVEEVIRETGAMLVPPYDHPDIILGQGTTALEMEEQYRELVGAGTDSKEGKAEVVDRAMGNSTHNEYVDNAPRNVASSTEPLPYLNAVIAPLGGGGLLSGIATYFSNPTDKKQKTLVYGAEPSYQGADDGRRGREAGKRIESVKTLTIADGLRTPVGLMPWAVMSDKAKVRGIYSVSEDEIKKAMKLVLERMKVFVEPSGVVGLAVVLFNEQFRREVLERQIEEKKGRSVGEEEVQGWNVGVVLSGGNSTVDAIVALFGDDGNGFSEGNEGEREVSKVGIDGARVSENVAG